MKKKDNEKKHGGKRTGAGRPKSDGPVRTVRTFKFTDEEWDMLNEMAEISGMSTREYISLLIEKAWRRKL